MRTRDVFISYSTKESANAEMIKALLEQRGMTCWLAPKDIPTGTSYATEINSAIKECKVFLLLLSKNAQKSKWVPKELDQAINANKVIIPLKIKQCSLTSEFEFYLANVQCHDAFMNRKEAFKNAIDEIEAIVCPDIPVADVNVEELPKKPLKAKKGKKRLPRKKAAWILAAVIGLALLSVLLHEKENIEIGGVKYYLDETAIRVENADIGSEEIEYISKMENVRTLELKDCVIEPEDIGNMTEGKKIYTLKFINCNLTDEQLKSIDFESLEMDYLDISGNALLKDLSPIEPLREVLYSLNISNTSVSDITCLSGFSKLTELRADNNGIEDISALGGCGKLRKLFVNNNRLKNLDALERCIELAEIEAADNNISSIAGLTNATVLTKVRLDGNNISDIGVLKKSAGTMQKLYLRNNKLEDISALENFTELRYIALDKNRIASLAPLKGSEKLIGISAVKNKITSTAGIEGKKNLMCVILSDNNLTAVGEKAPLTFEGDGAILDLCNNKVESINTVCGGRYRYMATAGCNIHDFGFLNDIKCSNIVIDYNEGLDFEALNKDNFNTVTIMDCPLDKQLSIRNILGTYKTSFAEGDASEFLKNYYSDYLLGE